MPKRRPSTATLVALLMTLAIGTQAGVAAEAAPRASQPVLRTDTTSPRRVRLVDVTAADASNVTVAWSRSRDNVGVEGYGVYLDRVRRSTTQERVVHVPGTELRDGVPRRHRRLRRRREPVVCHVDDRLDGVVSRSRAPERSDGHPAPRGDRVDGRARVDGGDRQRRASSSTASTSRGFGSAP